MAAGRIFPVPEGAPTPNRELRVQDTMRATSAGRARRRPKTYGGERVCAEKRCETRLSRYNRETFCFAHAPTKYRRMRGEFTTEYASRNS
jgi:hypothetical protein